MDPDTWAQAMRDREALVEASPTDNDGRTMFLVDVTPELARLWLATRCDTVSDLGIVRRYAAAMRDGSWRLQRYPIAFYRGRLYSSWRRLAAVILADMTIPMYVHVSASDGVLPPGLSPEEWSGLLSASWARARNKNCANITAAAL
jgi:hypothetical protein